ncbi:subtilisin-like protease SBT5.3 isoform X2 [Cannabis sativa]|uniref:subtilisin-like protease SBT5.3 isoform X2 n=1 Tax=Cannabis sativa TaxID=3483 RepID=UPI0029CAA696|nr:subtilisin-like protease SBT5.3 isoform X2 [Cannabis sativa]
MGKYGIISYSFKEKLYMDHIVSSSFLSLFLLFILLQQQGEATKKPYIVYLGTHSHSHGVNPSSDDLESATNSHYNLLGSYLGSEEKAKDAIFYSYNRHINGFAAILDETEAAQIRKHPDVISVFLSKGVKKFHTTHSWEFQRLERKGVIPYQSIWSKTQLGEDVIIGNLDSGVWSESKSFDEYEGIGPIPSKWRGSCQPVVKDKVRCNRKLIGAKYFSKGYIALMKTLINNTSSLQSFMRKVNFFTSRDREGHGTHTLSTAGGSFVHGANIFGNGNGTAKGGSPKARVAAYKIGGWLNADDMPNAPAYTDADVMAGFDAAISDGVDIISLSLGSDTPTEYFDDVVSIGSFHAIMKNIVVVASAGNEGPDPKTVTSVSPWTITVAASTLDREFYNYVSLGNKKHLKGVTLSSGGLPSQKFYPLIYGNPVAYITPTKTKIGVKPAPVMASFSSRGPNVIQPALIKPDITAPGVLIIAAYSESASPTSESFDKRQVKFNAISGTSMSCPQVSGIAGLLKSLYPNWSSAAIHSAIMTTARVRDNNNEAMLDWDMKKATPFQYGSGHIQPNRAMDPGLVYDRTIDDYMNFLCAHGYNETMLKKFYNKSYKCPKSFTLANFNYPSIAVTNLSSKSVTIVIRKVKNVGSPGTYKAYVRAPPGVSIYVRPNNLQFTKVGEEKKFEIILKPKVVGKPKDYVFGQLKWSDGKHYVRSPIAVKY